MAAATQKSSKAGGFGGKIVRFFREVRRELGKVLWPSRSEAFSYTTVVLVTVAIVVLLVWLVDSALTQILKLILAG